jgi:hypothetical protein
MSELRQFCADVSTPGHAGHRMHDGSRPGHNEGVDKRERKEILGEWGVRPPNPVESQQARRLAADLDGSPLVGRALPPRVRLRTSPDSYVASLGGPLPYMRRLREIDALTEAHEERLAHRWRELADECARDRTAFERRWREVARRWVFDEVNDLIEAHNRWFPAEARLPMDPRTGDFVLVGGERYDRRPLDGRWVLERFPPELGAVAA